MRRRRLSSATALAICWTTTLCLVSLVLLWTAEPSSFQYWVRVGVVAILWGIFLLVYTPLRALADIKVITAKADTAIIVTILLAFLLVTLVLFINAVLRGGFAVALVTGVFGLGILNVLREAAAKARKQREAGRTKTQDEGQPRTDAK